MSDRSLDGHDAQSSGVSGTFWFAGSTAVKEGQGFCHNWDKASPIAAITRDPNRGRDVEVPTQLNAPYFAGVAKCAYPANSDGQYVELWLPGSVCNVWSTVSNTIGVGRTTCQVGDAEAGAFGYGGFPGKGTAVPLQTIDRSDTAGVCLCQLEEGPQSGLQETITTATLTTAGGAVVFMIGGMTHIEAAVLTDADATFTVADGTFLGQKKGWSLHGVMTTNNIVLTYTNAIQHVTGETALATWTADADLEEQYLEWRGVDTNATWVETLTLGGTIA